MKKLMFAAAMAAAMTASADLTWKITDGIFAGNNQAANNAVCYLVYADKIDKGSFSTKAYALADAWENATGSFSDFIAPYGYAAKVEGNTSFALSGIAQGEYIAMIVVDDKVVQGANSSAFFFSYRNGSDLLWSGSATQSNPGDNGVAPGWRGSAAAIPEPTSALLMLLGMAGLALKRKQA